MSRRITREPEPIRYNEGDPIPEGCAIIYALEGYPTKRSKRASSVTYALTVSDLPHGGWVAQGCYREVSVPMLTQVASMAYRSAVGNSRAMRRERAEPSAETFADVAGDNDGLKPLYDLLLEHADLWARSEPHGTQPDLRDFMHRCVYCLAARLLQDADALADNLDVEWGADAGGDE